MVSRKPGPAEPPRELPKAIAPPWFLLLALAPLLSLLLAYSLPIDLSDHPTPDQVRTLRPGREAATSPTLNLSGPWLPGDAGWVAQGADCRVAMEFEPGPWRSLRLMVNGTAGQQWVASLRRDYQSVVIPTVEPGKEILLEGPRFPPAGTGPLKLELAPRPPLAAGGPTLARVSARVSPFNSDDRPPALPGVVVGGLLPFGLALFLLIGRRRGLEEKKALALGGVVGIFALALPLRWIQGVDYLWAATTACFLGASVAAALRALQFKALSPDQSLRLWRVAEGAAVVTILSIGLWMRWEEVLVQRNLPLLDDARGYMQIAREGSFYSTAQDHGPWVREPLFPALLRLWLTLAPDTVLSARFGGALFGLVPVFLIWLAGRRLFSPWVGLGAALFAATNSYMAGISVAVLRDDLLLALFLGLLAMPPLAGERRWWRAILFGLLGAGLGLTRLNALFLMVPFVATEVIRRRWNPAEVALVFLVAVPPVLPHLAFNHHLSGGDWMYSSNVHTRYYLNRDMIGHPGFPATLAEWDANPYAGPVAKTSELIRQHGPLEWLRRVVRGYVLVFLWEFPHEKLFLGKEWLMLPLLAGAVAALRRWRELWWVAAWFVVFLLPLALVATIHLDRRLALPAVPIILWLWAMGVEEIGRLVWERASSVRRNQSAVDSPKSLTNS